MNRYLALVLAFLFSATVVHAQPASWNYSFDQNGIAQAYFPGKLTGPFANAFVAASDFGVSTSNVDNSAALMAIDKAGKVAVLAPGTYNISHTVVFSHDYTGLKCATNAGIMGTTGGNVTGYPATACIIKWTGASQGQMFQIAAPTGVPAVNYGRIHGNSLYGITLDCNNGLTGNALEVWSAVAGTYDTVSFWNCAGTSGSTGYALQVDVNHNYTPPVGTNFSEPPTPQFNEFRTISIGPGSDLYEVGIYINYGSFDNFTDVNVYCNGKDCVQIVGCDNVLFHNLVAYQESGTSGYGVHFMTTHTFGGNNPSNNNTIWNYSGSLQAVVYSDGTAEDPQCQPFNQSPGAYWNCTSGNVILGIDKANAVPDPVQGNGAQASWSYTNGVLVPPYILPDPQTAPTTNTGSCTGFGPATGGATAGSFSATAACSSIVRLVFPFTAPHGWICDAKDVTNTAVTMSQTFDNTTYCQWQVLNASIATSDKIEYKATAY